MDIEGAQGHAPDLDDRKFAATWLLAAVGVHLWTAGSRSGIHDPAAKGADLFLDCASWGTVAYISVWAYCVLFLQLEGRGRRTALGIAVMLIWPLAALLLHPKEGIGLLAIANGLAAFAMFGRRFPIAILDGLFSNSGTHPQKLGRSSR